MVDPRYLLDDGQMRQFIEKGYLVLKTELPAEAHREIYARTEEVFAREGNPGNNILPRVPQTKQVFDDPVIAGALTSVLGPDHVMHSHRHPHISPAGGKGGGWHKDSYWGYQKVRSHRCRWAMIFYYPQDVDEENGPTAVLPGTQYYGTKVGDEERDQVRVLGEAGTVALVHFDIWHRATPNNSAKNRYMMKFQFTRMSEPTAPSWKGGDATWPEGGAAHSRALCTRLWAWHRGGDASGAAAGESLGRLRERLGSSDEAERLEACNGLAALNGEAAGAVEDMALLLGDESERVRLNAAYALAAVGEKAAGPLARALGAGREEAAQAAAYGLGALGAAGVEPLCGSLAAEDEKVRGYAAYALGDVGAVLGAEGVALLADRVGDPSAWVRRHAAESLGTLGVQGEQAVPALCRFMADEDAQTRFNAAYSLARLGPQAAEAVPALVKALRDENRYVSGHSVTALRRIATPEAQEALLDFLAAARWCPLTSKESTF